MTLNNKYWRARFSNFETFIHKLIFVKNDYYPSTIKNDNGAIAMRKFFRATRTEATTPWNFKKEYVNSYKTWWTVPLR